MGDGERVGGDGGVKMIGDVGGGNGYGGGAGSPSGGGSGGSMRM
jgi:hypothetical protein